MKPEKIIGVVLTAGFILHLMVVGNKVGSSAGREAAEKELNQGKNNIEGTEKQSPTFKLPLISRVINKREDQAKHVSLVHGMKMIGNAFFEFLNEFGTYPNEIISTEVKNYADSPELFDNNYLFSQLLATDLLATKEFLKTPADSIGEWLYYGHALSSKSNPRAVILISPIVRGKRGVLHIDTGVNLMSVEESDELAASIKIEAIRIPQRH